VSWWQVGRRELRSKAMNAPKPGVRLPYQLESSEAFLSLTGKAPQVLLLLMRRRRMSRVGRRGWIITNNGEIEFTYKEALDRYGITHGQFRRAIDQLVAHGFIDVTETGGAYRRHKSKFPLIENWRNYGRADFKPGRARKPDPVKRGYRKPKRLKAVA
jgi:hypothetical protein